MSGERKAVPVHCIDGIDYKTAFADLKKALEDELCMSCPVTKESTHCVIRIKKGKCSINNNKLLN